MRLTRMLKVWGLPVFWVYDASAPELTVTAEPVREITQPRRPLALPPAPESA